MKTAPNGVNGTMRAVSSRFEPGRVL